MYILLFIFIFIIAILVFGLSIIGFILRTIFGLGRGSSSSRPKQTEPDPEPGPQHTNQQEHDRRSHKKIFTRDEGEYVDFEEIN